MSYFINHITKSNDGIATDRILKHILHSDPTQIRTYIILGRPGPTGKTWVQKKLTDLGYIAIEISEGTALSDSIEYKDDRNHVVDLPTGITVVILNQWIN